ncbi:hypothetical protein MHYP_G00210240 [Metynnis hypsauchen]
MQICLGRNICYADQPERSHRSPDRSRTQWSTASGGKTTNVHKFGSTGRTVEDFSTDSCQASDHGWYSVPPTIMSLRSADVGLASKRISGRKVDYLIN